MAFLHEEEDDHNHKDEKKEYGAEDRYLLKSQKAHPIGKFVIVAKFGGHALRYLASRLANVIRQGGGREGEKQTKNLVLAIKKKLFYNCFTLLCTISGFSNVKKGTFCRVTCLYVAFSGWQF